MNNVTAVLKSRENFSELFGELYTFHFKNLGGQMLVNLLAFVISVTYMILCHLIFSYSEADAVLGGVAIAAFIIITFPVIYVVGKVFKAQSSETEPVNRFLQLKTSFPGRGVDALQLRTRSPKQPVSLEDKVKVLGEIVYKSNPDTKKIAEVLRKSVEEIVKMQEKHSSSSEWLIHPEITHLYPKRLMVFNMDDIHRLEIAKTLIQKQSPFFTMLDLKNRQVALYLDPLVYEENLKVMDRSVNYVQQKIAEVLLEVFTSVSHDQSEVVMLESIKEMCAKEGF